MGRQKKVYLKKLEQLEKERRPADEIPRMAAGKEKENSEFGMHDLVEGFYNEGWCLGVVSGIKNPETGKFGVSFPSLREEIELSPSKIRPQSSFSEGKQNPTKGEIYKAGDKVEAVKIREKYGTSWFPATVEKVIADNIYFLIKYENNSTEIIEAVYLKPINERNHRPDNFELNSHVEFFHEGGWSNGVVTRVLSEGNYEIRVSESDDAPPEQVIEQFLRPGLQCALGKRGRPAENSIEIPNPLKKKNKMVRIKQLASKKKTTSQRNSGDDLDSSLPSANQRACKRSSCEGKSADSADADADMSNGKTQNLQSSSSILPCPTGTQEQTPSSCPLLSTSPNPNPNPSTNSSTLLKPNSNPSTPSNPNPLTPLNPNASTLLNTSPSTPKNPSSSTPPNSNRDEIMISFSSISGRLVLTSEGRSSFLKAVEKLDIFKNQKPYFASHQGEEDLELECNAIFRVMLYASLVDSIQNPSPDDELVKFEIRLASLNSLEKDGFQVDPLRTRLKEQLEKKKEITELASKLAENEYEADQIEEVNTFVCKEVDKLDAELVEATREWEERVKRIKDERERCLEETVVNGDRISYLKSENSRFESEIYMLMRTF